jgi:hypothetical protein
MCGIVAAAVRLRIFELCEGDGVDVDELARRRELTARVAQALLDGLHGLGLVVRAEGRYRNSEEASFYLVPGRADHLGDGTDYRHR